MAMFSTATTATAVTNQEKIKYLKRYILLDREIDQHLQEIDHWRDKLSRITSVYTKERHGGGSIRYREEAIIARIVDMERALDAEIDELITIRDHIRAAIDAVEDDRERLLLRYRYLEGLPWELVAVKLNYSWQHTHRLHSRALSKLKMRENESIDR